MEFKFNDKKDIKNKGKKGKKEPKFLSSIASAILIFMLITAVYLAFSSSSKSVPEVSISDLAKSITAGEVTKISIKITLQRKQKKKQNHLFHKLYIITE